MRDVTKIDFDRLLREIPEEQRDEVFGILEEHYSAAILDDSHPLVLDDYGTLRFKENKIVDFMLKELGRRGYTLNELWVHFLTTEWKDDPEKLEDMKQLYRLIGMSLSGFEEVHNFWPKEEREALEKAAREGLEEGKKARGE